jgi:hypothetical protein
MWLENHTILFCNVHEPPAMFLVDCSLFDSIQEPSRRMLKSEYGVSLVEFGGLGPPTAIFDVFGKRLQPLRQPALSQDRWLSPWQ